MVQLFEEKAGRPEAVPYICLHSDGLTGCPRTLTDWMLPLKNDLVGFWEILKNQPSCKLPAT